MQNTAAHKQLPDGDLKKREADRGGSEVGGPYVSGKDREEDCAYEEDHSGVSVCAQHQGHFTFI